MTRRNKEKWQEIINRQQQSGLNAAQFCRNEKIAEKYFSTKKNQLLKESSSAFTKINITKSTPNPTLEFNYKNSTLNFHSIPDPLWLSQLMSKLP